MSNPQRQRIQAAGRVSAKPLATVQGFGGLSASGLDQLYQQGSARIRFPGAEPGALQAVLINTAGGLTGDDNIRWEASTCAHAHLSVSTAACEKVYRTHGPAAKQETRLSVAAHGRLEWLPQETILFNGANLHRTLDIELEDTSEALICESLIVGRKAMQEQVDRLQVRDRWRIRRGDRLLHAEDLHLNIQAQQQRSSSPLPSSKSNTGGMSEFGKAPDPSDHETRNSQPCADTVGHSVNHSANQASAACMLDNFSAISTLVLISQRSNEWLHSMAARVRALSDGNTRQVRLGASVLPHRVVVRVLASDSFQLRRFLIPCISLLNDGRSVPTVWKV